MTSPPQEAGLQMAPTLQHFSWHPSQKREKSVKTARCWKQIDFKGEPWISILQLGMNWEMEAKVSPGREKFLVANPFLYFGGSLTLLSLFTLWSSFCKKKNKIKFYLNQIKETRKYLFTCKPIQQCYRSYQKPDYVGKMLEKNREYLGR